MLSGGPSSEHDVSLASARSVLAALDPERYETVTIPIDRSGRWELAAGRDAGGARDRGHAHRRPLQGGEAARPVSRERIKVAVLMGGRSSEHPISIESARSVLEALDPERYERVSIEIGRDGRWALEARNGSGPAALPPGAEEAAPAETLPVPAESAPATLAEVDVVLPILHGPFGEDGTVQGLLELAGVPYVGAGVAASALCMDKDLFKAIMRDRGIPVTRNVTLRDGDPVEHPFGYPVFVKPARLGSSVGISKVREPDELEAAVELARRHEQVGAALVVLRRVVVPLVSERNDLSR